MEFSEVDAFMEKWAGFIFMMLMSIVILFGSIYFWDWLSEDLSNGDTVRNIALSIGGIWAIYAVLLATVRVKIMQQQQISENLARAAEQLSSDIVSVRILAIFSLGSIAMEMDIQIRRDVIKILCFYIQEKCLIRNERGSSIFPDDLKQVIYVLSNIQHKKREVGVLDLSFIYLSNVNLSDANLSDANLIGADLSGANLRNSDLLDASLSGANLSDANLHNVDLKSANLSDANLHNADLSDASLYGANLSGADLNNANLLGVRGLHRANNLEAVVNPPPEILAAIQRKKTRRFKFL